MNVGPRSLRMRITLLLLLGLIGSNLVGLLIYTGDRSSALLSATGATDAARIAAAVRTMENLTARDREAAVCAQSGPGLAVALSAAPVASTGAASGRARRLLADLRDILGPDAAQSLIVAGYGGPAFAAADPFAGSLEHCASGLSRTMATMMSGDGMMTQMSPRMRAIMQRWSPAADTLVVSAQLDDGSWLNILTQAPRLEPVWRSRFLLAFLAVAAGVSALSVWAVRRSTEPLEMFAWAAERLGRNVDAPDLPEDGPDEVDKAARAFNEMQRRLRRLIGDRTRMLAAVSHDLRTPITRLRLRAEFVQDDEQREKMLSDLAQMEAMISATLAFARLDSSEEAAKPLDLAGLVRSVCDDAAELGRDVHYVGADRVAFTGRPVALRRVFENLVDNAVKYGHRAIVRFETSPEHHIIIVEDNGPGIPRDALQRVFEPFQRLETSRSRETGGVGLGLAVVRSILRGHGGNVILSNRPEGGLRATVTLPREKEWIAGEADDSR